MNGKEEHLDLQSPLCSPQVTQCVRLRGGHTDQADGHCSLPPRQGQTLLLGGRQGRRGQGLTNGNSSRGGQISKGENSTFLSPTDLFVAH